MVRKADPDSVGQRPLGLSNEALLHAVVPGPLDGCPMLSGTAVRGNWAVQAPSYTAKHCRCYMCMMWTAHI